MSSGLNKSGVVPDMRSLNTLSDSNNSGSLPAATPVVANNKLDNTLEDLFNKAGASPPPKKALAGIYMSEVMTEVDRLLNPIQKGWRDLEDAPLQQAKMSFLVLRGQPRLLQEQKYNGEQIADGSSSAIAQDLWNAVAIKNCFPFKRVDALVKKDDGDERTSSTVAQQQEGKDYFTLFLEKHEADWSDSKKSPTLFNHADDFCRMKPLFRFQEDDSSTVCSWVASANAIFYSMCLLHTRTKHDEAVEHYALDEADINRFMRNNCSNEELFDIIFMGNGGCPVLLLRNLLSPFNTKVPFEYLTSEVSIESDIDDDDTDDVPGHRITYRNIKTALRKKGALIVERFKSFPERSGSELRFHGSYNDKEQFDETKAANIYHAVLVVGVRLTDSIDDMGGIEFLIQNSWESKPFFTVGYDLLQSMGGQRTPCCRQ